MQLIACLSQNKTTGKYHKLHNLDNHFFILHRYEYYFMTIISASYTFPPVGWWLRSVSADQVIIDKTEKFEKMTPRNRYSISGANNAILLSIPLDKGRNQQNTTRQIKIKNDTRWQTQHWRALTSTYNRSPYFFHYKDSLQKLYETKFDFLTDFNDAALLWVLNQLKLKIAVNAVANTPDNKENYAFDLRIMDSFNSDGPEYYQIFADRIGYLPNLSILDLLFSEGPATRNILSTNAVLPSKN